MKKILFGLFIIFVWTSSALSAQANKKIAYLVSDISIPFWQIMAKGIETKAKEVGYEVDVFNASNHNKTELENIIKVIKDKYDGIILSPINSSTGATLLKFANEASVPAVVADIGTDSGKYITFVSSNNENGAYHIGKILATKMNELKWDKKGSVGIIAIPQKRANGQARTKGFMQAMKEAKIATTSLYQQVDFSHEETYIYTSKLIKENPNLRAIWLQGSDKYKGALEAITHANKKGEILLLCFDAEPEFIELIQNQTLTASAMQQPFLMGQASLEALYKHFNGKRVKQNIQMEVMAVSSDNITKLLPKIKRNVLGLE